MFIVSARRSEDCLRLSWERCSLPARSTQKSVATVVVLSRVVFPPSSSVNLRPSHSTVMRITVWERDDVSFFSVAAVFFAAHARSMSVFACCQLTTSSSCSPRTRQTGEAVTAWWRRACAASCAKRIRARCTPFIPPAMALPVDALLRRRAALRLLGFFVAPPPVSVPVPRCDPRADTLLSSDATEVPVREETTDASSSSPPSSPSRSSPPPPAAGVLSTDDAARVAGVTGVAGVPAYGEWSRS